MSRNRAAAAHLGPPRSLLVATRRTLVLAISLCVVVLPNAASAATRTVSYSIAKRGNVNFGMRPFARIVDATLNDPRGWSLGGSVAFKRVPRSSIQVTLSAPRVVGSFGGCSRQYSCRAGSYVLINADRWAHATPTYPGQALRHSYRQLVINHEVGHALGFGHANCAGVGRAAPVMQQQSKGLHGCNRNVWPTRGERGTFARRLGATVRTIPPSLELGRQAGRIELGVAKSGVLARLGAPTTSSSRQQDGAPVDTYSGLSLDVRYVRSRVQAVTTRSPADIDRNGVRVGISERRLRGLVPRLTCTDDSDMGVTCVTGRAERSGDQPTTFIIRDGGVTAIRVERLLTDVGAAQGT